MQTIHTLYQGQKTIIFDDFQHQYTSGGAVVPSVTQVLDILSKPQLIPWAARVAIEHASANIFPGATYTAEQLERVWEAARWRHNSIKREAGEFGGQVHNLVHEYLTGKCKTPPEDPQVAAAIGRLWAWINGRGVEFLASEQVVYSRLHNYVGTLDAICRIDGKLYIFDLKTNNGLYKLSMGCQMAAYLEAYREEHPEVEFAGCILVRVGKKDGEFEVWEVNDWTPFYETFKAIRYLYGCLDWLKTNNMI